MPWKVEAPKQSVESDMTKFCQMEMQGMKNNASGNAEICFRFFLGFSSFSVFSLANLLQKAGKVSMETMLHSKVLVF